MSKMGELSIEQQIINDMKDITLEEMGRDIRYNVMVEAADYAKEDLEMLNVFLRRLAKH